LALRQYSADNNNRFLVRYADSGTNSRKSNWRVAIFPYLKSTDTFRCPSNPSNLLSATVTTAANATKINASYACNYNSAGLGVFGNNDGAHRIRVNALPYPSETISVAESLSTEADLDMDDVSMIGQVFAGHNGVSNYLFVDGHVKAMSPLQTYYSTEGTIRNLWHRDHSPFSG